MQDYDDDDDDDDDDEHLCHKKDGHPLVVRIVQDAVVWLFSRAVALLES